MSRSINAFPKIDPLNFFKSRNGDDPIFSHPDFHLYASGRAAVHHGMKMTALPKESVILVPSFNCGVEIEGIIRAGYSVEFYEIDKNLEIDFKDLKSRLTDKTRGLMIIHYFGFPQKMEEVIEFCKTRKLLLIEDCGHALYSRYKKKWLGTFGDFGFFSLQKTIALPNGGGLLCNVPEKGCPQPGKGYFELSLIKSTVRSILEFYSGSPSLVGKASSAIIKTYLSSVNETEGDPASSDEADMRWYYDVARYDYQHAISALSKPLLAKDNFESIIKKRRENYFLLGDKLKESASVKIINERIGEGVCPLCLVIETKDRDEVVRKMNEEGIFPFVFGRFPHPAVNIEKYGITKNFAESLIGLPVHHQLGKKDITFIANVLLQSVKHLF